MRFSAQTALNHAFFNDIRDEMELFYQNKSSCHFNMCNHTPVTYQDINVPDCHLLHIYKKLLENQKYHIPNPKYLDK